MSRWHVLIEPAVPILLLASIVHAVRRNLFDLLLFTGTAVLITADAWRGHAAPKGVRPSLGGSGLGGSGVEGGGVDRGGLDRGGLDRHSNGPRRTHWGRGWALLLAAVVFAGAVGPLPRSSVAMKIVLTLCALAALVVVMTHPGEPSVGCRHPSGQSASRSGQSASRSGQSAPDPSGHGWIVWAALGVLACLWELTSFAIQQSDPSVAAEEAHPSVSDLVGPLLASWPGRIVFLLLWASAGWWLLRRVAGRMGADR